MAVEFKINADNSGEVLRALGENVQAALEAVGNQAVSHAKSIITEESRVDTGALRNSISHQVQENVCYVGTNQEYAIYNEIGTGIYTDGGSGRQTPWSYQDAKGNWHKTSGMKPIHFLKNALANNINEYREILKEYLSK